MMWRTTKNLMKIFITVVVLALILMVASYTIPTENAHENIVKDAYFFFNLDQYVIPNDFATRLDIFTDTLIFSEIAYYNENVSLIDNAMSVYGIHAGSEYQNFTKGDDSVIREYPRYWHGNVVVFKVLFNFLDDNGVRILELFFEAVMIIAIIKLMFENNLKNYIIPFAISIFFIHPEVIGLTLAFGPMFNVMLISVYVLLKFKEKWFKNNRLFYYFMIVGMVTSFFDFLTFPLISFGIPMIFYLILEEDTQSLKNNIIKIFLFGIIWSVGYLGMWFSKWVISSLILNENVIENGLTAVLSRSTDAEFSRIDAILRNVSVYGNISYLLPIGLIIIYYVKKIFDLRENITVNKIKYLVPFILMAAIPFVWFFLASNHSYIHFWFTYRELLITFLALMCSAEFIIKKEEGLGFS